MKKVIGWILMILGGLFCVSSLFCIPVAFVTAGLSLLQRLYQLMVYIIATGLFAMIFFAGLRLKTGYTRQKREPKQKSVYAERMTSQLPALYLNKNDLSYRDAYLERLTDLGFEQEEAEKLFWFECDVIKTYDKPFLLEPGFTNSWFFSLKQPLLYPKTREQIMQEKCLTISEACKMIDEAEWHFWNSHEKAISDAVWTEITQWRIKGEGGKFAIRYFGAVADAIGIAEDHMAKLVSEQGAHLNRYKWNGTGA